MTELIENAAFQQRPTWDEYFMLLTKLAAMRSTCLAFPVGAVIVKNKQVLATGYNGSPSGSVHCTTQGYCYPEMSNCTVNNETTFNKGNNAALCQSFVDEGLVTLKQIHISTSVLQRANLFLNSPTSELRLFS